MKKKICVVRVAVDPVIDYSLQLDNLIALVVSYLADVCAPDWCCVF